MFFPFSFWGNSVWETVTENIEFTDPFLDYFDAVWTVTETEEYTEPFNAYFDALWAGVTEDAVEFTEDFAGAW